MTLERLLKKYGTIIVKDYQGESVEMVWDYAQNRGRIKKHMTMEELAASEKVKSTGIYKKPVFPEKSTKKENHEL